MTAEPSMWRDEPAEQCVLGAMMLSQEVADQMVSELRPDDFYAPAHEKIFQVMVDLMGAGKPVDAIHVSRALVDSGELNRVGGAPYLHTLIESVPTVLNAGDYATIVVETALRRRLELASRQVQGAVRNAGMSGMDAYGQAMSIMEKVILGESRDVVTPAMILPGLLERIRTGAIREEGIPTGYLDLDRLLHGLGGGKLYYVAGRPGMGKSVFLADVARHVSLSLGIPSLFFELEMDQNELAMRMLSAESGIPLSDIQQGKLGEGDGWQRLQKAADALAEAPLEVYDETELSLPRLEARVKYRRRASGTRVVIVDYLQLMQANPRISQRQEQVSELSRGLKLLARREHVAVIVAAQLNRGPETRMDKRPQLSDLRESGSLEQDCDVAILLHREDYYDSATPRGGEADFIVAKHRNGSTGTVPVAAQLHVSRFVNLG